LVSGGERDAVQRAPRVALGGDRSTLTKSRWRKCSRAPIDVEGGTERLEQLAELGGGVVRNRTTSASSGDPFNDRQPFEALTISLKTIAKHAERLPFHFVLSCLRRTVANTLSIGLVVRMCTQCSAGKSSTDTRRS
jgi:hypothetical protein